ncbi:MAG: outer membrane beta-barrel protein [Cyclobacteriaceae bacterium]
MTNLKNFLLTVFLTSIPFLASYGQDLKFGARAALGTGTINSKALQTYFNAENSQDADIKKYDLNAKLGSVFSLGGFVEYSLNKNFSLLGEVAFQQQGSNLQIDLMEDDAQSGLTFRDEVKSNNQIKISALTVPLLARYYLNAKSGPYLTGGFTVDLVLSSKIEAKEDILKRDFDAAGSVIRSTSEARLNEAKIDRFGSPRVSFTIGVGTVLDAGPSGITIDLRYNAGLSKTDMYTSNLAFDDLTKESDVFSVYKQADISINDRITLNDFKTGTLLLVVGYRF